MDALAISVLRPLAIGAALFVWANGAYAGQASVRVVRTDIGSALNILLDSLSTISSAIEVESRCAHLSAEMDLRFLENQKAIHSYLETVLLPQAINRIRANSSLPEDSSMACGRASDRFVTKGFYLADYLATLINSRSLN